MSLVARPAISVAALRKSYGPVAALDGVSFEVPAGPVLGFSARTVGQDRSYLRMDR